LLAGRDPQGLHQTLQHALASANRPSS
jgi:hypothetical protein